MTFDRLHLIVFCILTLAYSVTSQSHQQSNHIDLGTQLFDLFILMINFTKNWRKLIDFRCNIFFLDLQLLLPSNRNITQKAPLKSLLKDLERYPSEVKVYQQ